MDHERLRSELERSQIRVRQLLDREAAMVKEKQELVRRLNDCEPKARDFNVLLTAIKENQLVKGAWDRFTMTLRMTGYDKNQ
jgi:hypothetical protein